MGKSDYIRGRHQISGRYSFFNHSQPPFIAKENILAADSNGSALRVQNLAVQDTFSAAPTLLFTTGFGWDQMRGGSRSSAPFSWADLGIKLAGPNPPETNVWVSGYFSVFTNHFGDFDRGDWSIREDVTKIKGPHELHFGGEGVRIKNHITNTWNMAGYFSFGSALSGDNLADFLLGQAPFFQQGGGEFKKMHGTRVGIYGQDSWRVRKKLTLNLGLRWDPYLPYVEDLKRGACFVPGKKSRRYANAPVGFLFIGGADQDLGCPANHSWPNLGNFAPRLGFAYRLTQEGNTSVRGGAGIYYIPPMTTQFNADANVAPFAPTFNFSDVNFDDPWGSIGIPSPFPAQFGPTIPAPDATFTLPTSIRWYFPPDFHSSTLYTWNLTLERQVGRDWLLRAAYVGNKGAFLSNGFKPSRETNPAIYVPGQSTEANTQQRRIYTNYTTIGLYSSDSNSHYNSLQLGAEKRFGRGFSVLTNYTWSKSIDDFGWSNPFNRKFDYGNSDEHVPHVLKFSNIWQIPTIRRNGVAGKFLNGWQTNGILIWRSGFPFSILSGRDNSFSAVGHDRADFIGTDLNAAQLSSDRPHNQLIAQWFDTSLFAANAVGTFGNTGKNILLGPRSFNTDLGFLKATQVTERTSIQFRAEFFNIFNNVNFRNPGNTLGGGDFGRLTSAFDPRIIQFGLKVLF
ncbi:MAG: hypothetical protein AUH86_20770 [Acidobacteria bacterium 13_1_40CM_4_58_4]|nr:MAG: hypothetical protein AUH86_20770 [Acidobacteria bacterium 13_1_40CM_4_58_4]